MLSSAASVVPEISGVASLVARLAPPASSKVFSGPMARTWVESPVFPAGSTTLATMVHSPARSFCVKFQVLSAWLIVVRKKSTAGAVWEKWIVMVCPAMSVVPVIVGSRPSVEPESIVTTGGAVSTVKICVNEPELPPPSVTLPTTVWSPSLSEPSRVNAHAPPSLGAGLSAWATPSMTTVTVLGATTLVTPEIAGLETVE